MTTFLKAASAYQAVNKITVCPQDFTLYRLIDNICAVERLCYKVAKAVLQDPISDETQIPLKSKYQDRFRDKRVLDSAVRLLQETYGNVDLKINGSTLIIFWKNSFAPSLKTVDHLNSKLFEAVVSNKEEKVKQLLDTQANPNASGPFGLTPSQVIHSNGEIYELLAQYRSDAESVSTR